MAKTESSKPSEPSPRPLLLVPKEQARQQLQAQIDKGREFLAREIRGPAEMHDVREEYYRWFDYNLDLLRFLFTTEEYARYHEDSVSKYFCKGSFQDELNDFHDDLNDHINKIHSIHDRLDVIREDPSLSHSITVSEQSQMQPLNKVFVVHGHDNDAKQTVARFIENLDLKAIILNERANQGQTLIEKFESNAGVRFAVILLTPDDVGTIKDAYERTKQLSNRARQNVIFELGFFIGKLGREHVCTLVKGDVEIPSDLHGFAYIQLDESGAWKITLAREMKESGIPIDLNKLG